MNESQIHRMLDKVFFRVLNDVLRKIGRVRRGRPVRIDRRALLSKALRMDVRICLMPRKRGMA